MELNEILSKVDHTLLAQTATWAEIKAICDDGMKYHTASVCIPASYVKQAKDYVGDKLPICTVIGFPNGYDTTKAKCLEALDAVQNGADEVDMVINIGWVKDQRWDDLLEEIKAVKQHCEGKLLKVIIETCLLTDDEKIKMCEIVSDSGADYIKTSTGFSTGGATFHDVELFAKHVKPGVKIKAAGGISSLDDAEKFIELGASRLGTSRVVKIVKKLEGKKLSINRSKGLGENDPEMMWMTTMNPETRRLIKVMPEDMERTMQIFDLLLGDNLQGRKEHIAENGYKYLDQLDVS